MRTVVPIALVLLLAGCAVGPDYRAPDLAVAGPFNGRAAVAARQATANADLATWWEGFHDPLLSRLVAQALAQNLDLAQAIARVGQSRAALRAAGAALLPSGSLSASGGHAHQSLETPIGQLLDATPNFNRNGNLYEVDAGASWELDLFGGLRREREAAQAEYAASSAGLAASRLAVAAQTADSYIALRGLQARLAIAREQLEVQQRLLATVRLQYAAGVAAELQLAQAEGALAQVQATIPVFEAQQEAAINGLDIMRGLQPGSSRGELAVAGTIPQAPAITDAGGPAELLRRRPDLIVAERRLAASNAGIGAAISGYYPKFSLSGLLGSATTQGGNLFKDGAQQGQLALGLQWRLFDFGRVDAEIAAARGRNAEALAAYRQAVLQASGDVENAFSALVQREQQERILAAGEKSLARASAASLAAYKGGVVSLIEVLDADTRLLAVRDARAQAGSESGRAAVASFRALGGGWDAAARNVL